MSDLCSRDHFAAHIHEQGKPRWGPLRDKLADAKADRQQLLAARRAGALQATLQRLRQVDSDCEAPARPLQSEFDGHMHASSSSA